MKYFEQVMGTQASISPIGNNPAEAAQIRGADNNPTGDERKSKELLL